MKLRKTILLVLLGVLALAFGGSSMAGPAFVDSDVCVYGGTSGGVVAAVAAARLGKSVSLVVMSNHVGGMTSGGLSVTDVGNAASIGGIAAEFYRRIGTNYGSSTPVYEFEPHAAEQTFLAMLAQAGVAIYTNELLAAVAMSNQVITQITMADGTVYVAKEFIDTTYEGDLMAMAGVPFTVGREGTNQYGESLAGIQVPGRTYDYSPYVVAGNTNSGLLPLVQSGAPGTPGQGDNKLQTYNFRLCLTQTVANQIPITAPPGYSQAQYALFSNYIAAVVSDEGSVTLEELINVQPIPNGKTDINADGELSTDYIGYNYTYPTNTYAARQLIYQQHSNYIAGLLYYLGTATNVPMNVRTDMLSWGYAADEFKDNGGWPYPLYVREARRMISDYVMLQQDVLGSRAVTDPVALGSYTLDSHPVARLAYQGLTQEEGDIGVSVSEPYPISYRSIVPGSNACRNLFCTFALSASHVGYASIRLEPTFMMLSQGAGVAAALAIDDNVPVQQLSYAELAAELIAENQLLTWGGTESISTNGVILDVEDTVGVTSSGSWPTGANSGGWPLPDGTYWDDGAAGKGSKWVQFTPTLPTNGTYGVYLWWVGASNRPTNAPVDVSFPGGTTRFYVNQQLTVTNWVYLMTTNFNAGTNASVTIRNIGTASGTYVIANAVRWMPTGAIAPPTNPLPAVAIVASDGIAGEFGTNAGRFSVVLLNGTNGAPLIVNYSIGGAASNGVDYARLPGSVTIPAGALAAKIAVTPQGDNLPVNSATVTLSLLASSAYTVTNPSSATLTILDRPLDAWRRGAFTPAQLANPLISGNAASPAGDGIPNLVKYALGLAPMTRYANVLNPQLINGRFSLLFQQSLAATDVSVSFQYSTDLITWSPSSTYLQKAAAIYQGATELVTWQAASPISGASHVYVRLLVTPL